MRGLSEGSGTRSSLLWECKRVIEGKKPKYLLLENVKNLVGKKNKPDFDKWLEWLESQGYTNYWNVINAKNHGVPQNRERVFVVSILGYHWPLYQFPEGKELTLLLKDILEDEVDEKYFLSKEIQERFVYKPTINEIVVEGIIEGGGTYKNDITKRVYGLEGIAPTIPTCSGGGIHPKILIKNATKLGYLEAEHGDGIDLAFPDSNTRRGRVQNGMSQTLTTSGNIGVLVTINRGLVQVRENGISTCLDGYATLRVKNYETNK